MSISKNIKKLFITGAALLMVASTGVGINNVNAKRRGHYHYRTHRTYRHKARRSTRRSKVRKPRRAHRKTRKVRRYRHRARRRVKRGSKRNMFSYFTPAKIRHLAKINGYSSAKLYKHDCFINNGGHIYGKPKVYNMNGYYMILTNYGLKHFAAMSNVSIPYVLKHYVKHATKYWDWQGEPTKLAIRETENDIVKDLNHIRAIKGIRPFTHDSNLQFLADKLGKQKGVTIDNGLYDAQQIANQYNIPDTASAIANYGSGADVYEKPSQIAKDFVYNLGSYEMSPIYNAIGISYDGDIELFGSENSSNDTNLSQSQSEVKRQTLEDLNQDRASVGESPLSEDSDLDNEAQQRSQELVSNFSHQNSNGEYASDEDSNVSAENIAYVYGSYGRSAANTMNKGLFYDEEANDGGHYQNIVNNSNVGVGVTVHNGQTYLAEDFN